MKAVGLAFATLFALVLATAMFAGPATDTDGDGVFDVVDSCRTRPNAAPIDCDTDQDGYGNICDGDFDNNLAISAIDYATKFVPSFKTGVDPGIGTDMDCNGVVNALDFGRFVPVFKTGKPGPSGLFCAGTVPCDL
jgi:hypothetical protein